MSITRVKCPGVLAPDSTNIDSPNEADTEARHIELREKIMPKFDKVVDAFLNGGSTAAMLELMSLREFNFPEITGRYGRGNRYIATAIIGRVLTDLRDLVQLLTIAEGRFNPALRGIISDIKNSDRIRNARTEFADEMTRLLSTTCAALVTSRREQGPEFEVFSAMIGSMLRPPVDAIATLIDGTDASGEMKSAELAHLRLGRRSFTRCAIELAVASTVPTFVSDDPKKAATALKRASRRSKIFVGIHLRSLISLYLRVADGAVTDK